MSKVSWQSILAAVLAAVLAVLGQRQLPPPSQPPVIVEPPSLHTEPATNPLDALGRLQMEGGYCSATPISPIGKDGKQVLLTAAHCVKRVGEQVQFIGRNGRLVRCSVMSINKTADACLLMTEVLQEPLPYLLVATETPAVGSPVFHAGFGIDNPGNVEKGRVLQQDAGNGQVMFELSVSPGDSGGGVCVDGSGKLISPVCCTTHLAARGQVFGAGPEVVREMQKAPAAFISLPPVDMPMVMERPVGQ